MTKIQMNKFAGVIWAVMRATGCPRLQEKKLGEFFLGPRGPKTILNCGAKVAV